MLTPYRQKYNPKKPKSKIKRFASTVQIISKKNFPEVKKKWKTGLYSLETAFFPKKSPSPFFNGEGRHQNTLHFKPNILIRKILRFYQSNLAAYL